MENKNEIVKKETMLRIKHVVEKVGVSKPTIYRLIKNSDFPKPRGLGKRAVGWRESEIDSWLSGRGATL